MYRPIRVKISEERLFRNATLLKTRVAPSKLLAVLKADAYGHGSVEAAHVLSEVVSGFAVCSMEEALKLRRAGVTAPLLLMSQPWSEEILTLSKEWSISLTLFRREDLPLLKGKESPLPLWIKFNSGMNRLGLSFEETQEVFESLSDYPGPKVLMSHLHSAETNPASAQKQCDRLIQLAGRLSLSGVSLCNSAGIFAGISDRLHHALPKLTQWVRPGFSLYGGVFEGDSRSSAVMRLSANVIDLHTLEIGESVSYQAAWRAQRPSAIATISAGYADGIPYANGLSVLIRGVRVPVVGKVCMDMLHLDVTELKEVALGDEVIFFGPERPVEEFAAEAGLSPYQLWCAISKRVQREWV